MKQCPKYSVNGRCQPRCGNRDGRCTMIGKDESFVENLKVGNEVVGHPLAGTMIYNGTDCNTTVKMLMRDTHTYRQIHPEVRK